MLDKEEKTCFVAVRCTEGREWFDIGTMDVGPILANSKAIAQGKRCGPHWEKDNPVVRIAEVQIKEIKGGEVIKPERLAESAKEALELARMQNPRT